MREALLLGIPATEGSEGFSSQESKKELPKCSFVMGMALFSSVDVGKNEVEL